MPSSSSKPTQDDSTIELRGELVARPRDLPLTDRRLGQSVEHELVPEKNTAYVFQEDDCLVVLAEDET